MTEAGSRRQTSLQLGAKLASLAHVPVLLVAADYDGTLAPIVNDPAAAWPDREAIVALSDLSKLNHTQVAVISGRARADLAQLSGLPESVQLVGSHGSEFDSDLHSALDPELKVLKRQLREQLQALADTDPGLLLEEKPASLALHYRNARAGSGDRVLEAITVGPSADSRVHVRHGKKVVELMLLSTHKGDALDRLRARAGASAVIFLGDDLTDEDAFETLTGADVGVKVGEGESRAEFRVDDPPAVARLLRELCALRRAWLGSGKVPPPE